MNIKVSFDNVSKKYNLEKNKKDKIKDLFLGRKSKSEFYGVRRRNDWFCWSKWIW